MAMPMVGVREMRVRVGERFVPMPMAMFNTGGHLIFVRVLVMFVVKMLVIVLHPLVDVSVLMALG
jgi:hypothetical protein